MDTADRFSALGDPTRCQIVELLADKSRPVHDLASAFDISRPAISRHLRVLKDAGLIKEEKRGRENLYSLQRARLKPLQSWMERMQAKVAAAPGKGKRAKAVEGTAEPVVEAVVALVTAEVEPVNVATPEVVVAAPAEAITVVVPEPVAAPKRQRKPAAAVAKAETPAPARSQMAWDF